jgi:hypothetical protein
MARKRETLIRLGPVADGYLRTTAQGSGLTLSAVVEMALLHAMEEGLVFRPARVEAS